MNTLTKNWRSLHLKAKDYLLHFEHEKLTIFSLDNLEIVEIIRNLKSDIQDVVVSYSHGIIYILLKDQLVAYEVCIQKGGQIIWKRTHFQDLDEDVLCGAISKDDRYMVIAHQKKLIVYLVTRTDTVKELQQVNKLKYPYCIRQLSFTIDNSQLLVVFENRKNMVIYDFDDLIEQKNTKKFEINNYDSIECVKVRETQARLKSVKHPNTFLMLDSKGILKVWQENTYQIDNQIFYFHVFSVQIGFAGMNWLNYKNYFDEKKQLSELGQSFNHKWGVYENQSISADYFLCLKNQKIKVYRLDGLRNNGCNVKTNKIYSIKNIEIEGTLMEVYFSQNDDHQMLEIVYQDRKSNLRKLIYDLENQSVSNMIHEKKLKWGHILHTSFDKKKEEVVVLNKLKEIVRQELNQMDCFPEEYNQYKNRKFYQLNNDFDIDSVQYICHSNNLVVAFRQDLQNVNVIQLQDNQKQVTYQLNLIQKMEHSKKELLKTEGISIVKMWSDETDLNLNSIKIVIMKGNHLFVMKLVFLVIKLIEQSNLQKLRDYGIQTQSNIELPDECLLVENIQYLELSDDLQRNNIKLKTNNDNLMIFIQENNVLKIVKVVEKREGLVIEKQEKVELEERFKSFGTTYNCVPGIHYVVYQNNDIGFIREKGNQFFKYQINNLFKMIDHSKLNMEDLQVKVKHLVDNSFILMINNYLILITLYFDKNKQEHFIKVMNKTNENKILFKRFKRDGIEFQKIYISESKKIYVQLKNWIMEIKNNMDNMLMDYNSANYQSDNLSYKLIQSQCSNLLYQHPEFIYEIVQQGQYQLLEILFQEITEEIVKSGRLSLGFYVSLDSFLKQIDNNEQIMTKWNELKQEYPQHPLTQYYENSDIHPLQLLLSYLQNNMNVLAIKPIDQIQVQQCLEFLIHFKENQRSLDFQSALFMFQVNRMKQFKKQKQVLFNKEVIWAIHTSHKDYLVQELIGKAGNVTWELLKQYQVPLWYDNADYLIKQVETIAKNSYRDKKDPFKVALYYILLQKKNVLQLLFKQQYHDQSSKKVSEFLSNDFSQERWSKAAYKNAYALMNKKDYMTAAAFFLLGGYQSDCIYVVIEYLEDIQLAILISRILKHKKIDDKQFNEIMEKQYINSDDRWAQHIGYWMKGLYIESVDCFYSQNDQINNSTFHPNSQLLVDYLKTTIQIKRVSQEDNRSINENKEIHLKWSLEYYLSIDNATLGLIWAKTNQNENSMQLLVNKLLQKYSQQLIQNAIRNGDWQYKFGWLFGTIKQLNRLWDYQLDHYVKSQIQSMDSLKLQIVCLQEQQIESVIDRFGSKIDKTLDYLCSSSPLKLNSQCLYFNLLYSSIELISSLLIYSDFQSAQNVATKAISVLFILSNELHLVDVQIQLLEMSACHQLDFLKMIVNGQQRLFELVDKVKQFIIDNVYELEYKTDKNTRHQDVLNEAFPLNLYQILENKQKYIMSNVDINAKQIVFHRIIDYILITNFGKYCQQTSMHELIQNYVERQYVACLGTFNYMNAYQSMMYVEQITNMFKELQMVDEVNEDKELYERMINKVQLDLQKIVEKLYLRLAKQQNKYRSQQVENVKSQYIQQNVELVRMKNESIRSVAYDYNGNLVILSSKGLRRVNLSNQLFNKTRGNQQYTIIEEEVLLNQNENGEKQKQTELQIDLSHSLLIRKDKRMVEQQQNDQMNSQSMMTHIQQMQYQKIEMGDCQVIVSSQNNNKLLVGAKGKVYEYEISQLQLLQKYITKNEGNIVQLKFNNLGDKFGCVDSQGNFYIFKISRNQSPIFMVNSSKQNVSDFSFVNNSTMVACIGHSSRFNLIIYDILQQTNYNIIQQETIGGNLIEYSNTHQMLCIASSKRNTLFFYEVNKQSVFKTLEV